MMLFLKAKTTNDKTEFFNLDKILTLVPEGQLTKILMGANLYWRVYTDSIEILDLGYNEIKETLVEATK